MPKPPYELSEEAIDKIVQNLQTGIPKVESAKDGYLARNKQNSNPDMQALGKYQFVPKYWWKDITAFAKKNGYDIKTHEDFLRSPSLQDSYFRHYVKNDIIPQANKALGKGNPEGLTLEEAAVFFHFQSPEVATKAITGGKEAYREATKKGVNGATVDNVSMKGYLNKYNSALEATGAKKVTDIEVMSPKEKEQIAKDYFNKVDTIIHFTPDLSKGERNKRIQELQSEYKAEGYLPVVNDYIDGRNATNKTEAQEKLIGKKEKLEKLLEYGEQADFFFDKGKNGSKLKQGSINLGSGKKAKEFEQFAKENGIKISGGKNFIYNIESQDYIKAVKGSYADVTGEKFDVKGFTDFDVDNFSNKVAGVFDFFGGEPNSRKGNLVFDKSLRDNIAGATGYTEIKKIDPNLVPDIPKPVVTEESTAADKKEETSAAKTEDKTETPGLEKSNAADEYFDQKLGLLGVKDGSTSPVESKRELPIDAVMGMALGLIGNEQAKNANIPLRTEEVSQAVKMFTSELAKRSKEGLPAEVEAAMNTKLAEAYQGGLENIKNASGGNRALVLGNQGQLETARNKGIIDIGLADYEAKEKAFQQYGEAIRYKNEFDARRDVANHSIKYQQGIQRQQDGRALATAGFAQMVEGIKYQKENGPGSINSMYEAHLMQKMFGFNPKAKDNGLGDTPGTKSYFDKQKAADQEKFGITSEYHQKLNSLNPSQKNLAGQFFENNTDEKSRFKFIDYLSKNPNVDPAKVKMDNMDVALKQDDFGLLSVSRKEAVQPTVSTVNELKPVAPILATPTIQPQGLLGAPGIGQPSVQPETAVADNGFMNEALEKLANLNNTQ